MFFIADLIEWISFEKDDCECDALRDLVAHCWVYSGYKNCGYEQMTKRQKELYDRTIRNIET